MTKTASITIALALVGLLPFSAQAMVVTTNDGATVEEAVNYDVVDIGSLPDHAHADLLKNPNIFLNRNVHPKSRNRFKFIQCSASMSQTASGNHRHRHAGCCYRRC